MLFLIYTVQIFLFFLRFPDGKFDPPELLVQGTELNLEFLILIQVCHRPLLVQAYLLHLVDLILDLGYG